MGLIDEVNANECVSQDLKKVEQVGTRLENKRIRSVVVNGVSVEDYGAVGDGVTDDTFAFQHAIDEINSYGGGNIILGSKVYLISSITLMTKTNIIGQGQGATIIKGTLTAENSAAIIVVPPNSTLCTIASLSIVGSGYTDANGVDHFEKVRHGIHIESTYEKVDGHYQEIPIYPGTSYRLQEDKLATDNLIGQSYRNVTIKDVYIGHCNIGIVCWNHAYRVNILVCDVKRCVQGIVVHNTDSSFHEIYVERNDMDGFICTGSNNNVSNIKSIWNGEADPYNSYGLKLSGKRNRYLNLEAQDNYCSGIYTSGQENMYTSIIANGNGYEYNLSQEDHGEGLCEWYVNTLNSVYENCIITNYTNRNGNNFPKYPILYGANADNQDQKVTILGTSDPSDPTYLSRAPIYGRSVINTTHIFEGFDESKLSVDGYLLDGVGSIDIKNKDAKIPVAAELTMAAQFHLKGIGAFNNSVYIGVNGSVNFGCTVRPNGGINDGPSASANILSISTDYINLPGIDVTKPIGVAVNIRGSRIESDHVGSDPANLGKYKYEINFGIWYYKELQQNPDIKGCYVYLPARKNDQIVNKEIINSFVGVTYKGVNRSPYYLQRFILTQTPCILSDISYPGKNWSNLVPLMAFDSNSASKDIRPVFKNFTEGVNKLIGTADPVVRTDQARVIGEWSNIVSNGNDKIQSVPVSIADLPMISSGIQLAATNHVVGARTSLAPNSITVGSYLFSALVKGQGTLYCEIGYYTGTGTVSLYSGSQNVLSSNFEFFVFPIDVPASFITGKANYPAATFDAYYIMSEAGGDVTICAPKLEKGYIYAGWSKNPNDV